MVKTHDLTAAVEEQLLERNRLFEQFFAREAHRLALACREMSDRFLAGGRLLAFGRGRYATDAQHVSVEFVHPDHRREAGSACTRSFSFVPRLGWMRFFSRRTS